MQRLLLNKYKLILGKNGQKKTSNEIVLERSAKRKLKGQRFLKRLIRIRISCWSKKITFTWLKIVKVASPK